MAKIEQTKMTVSLDNDSKRVIRNLTKAIDRLASRKWHETGGASGVKRLSEPAEDPAPVIEYAGKRDDLLNMNLPAGVNTLETDNENCSPGEEPNFASGGYVSEKTMPEPDSGYYIPGSRVELDATLLNALQASVGKYNTLR